MKKITLFVIALLITSIVYAQPAREVTYSTDEGKTNYTSVGLVGLNRTGNPGYLELRATENDSNTTVAAQTFYLWVDSTGDLCLASRVTISAYSSFPTGSWQSGMPCTKVGGQS